MFYGRMLHVMHVFTKKRRIIVGDFINLILVILLILFIAGAVMAIDYLPVFRLGEDLKGELSLELAKDNVVV